MARKKKKKVTRVKKQVRKKRSVKKVVKKEKKSLLIYIAPFLVLIILLLSFVSFLTFLFVRNYQSWELEFSQLDGIVFIDLEAEKVDLDKKILGYNQSRKEYAFVEFTKKESLFLISKSLGESLPDWVILEKAGLIPTHGFWRIYLKTSVWGKDLPWFEIWLLKDNVQSVDIYVEDLFLGNISLKNFGGIVEKVNGGFTRSMRLINDGNFAGRIFENIELGSDGMVIKSRNISF